MTRAARQGYRAALVPPDAGAAPPGMRLVEVPDLGTVDAGIVIDLSPLKDIEVGGSSPETLAAIRAAADRVRSIKPGFGS